MQAGIAVGTCAVLVLSRLGISEAFVPLFQTSVVVMLVLIHIVKTYLKVGVHSRQELLSCVEKRIHPSEHAE